MENKNNRLKIYLPLIIVAAITGGIFLGNWIAMLRLKVVSNELSNIATANRQKGGSTFSLNPRTDKINAALYYVLNKYVDTISAGRIDEAVMPAITEVLDPHSVYIPATDYQKYNEPLTGNFSGIGVQFNMSEDTVAIISTIPNGPSEIVGIRPGDRIISIDDSVVAGVNMPSDDIVKMLKGIKGTSVRVSILRRGEPQPIEFSIIRDDIPLCERDILRSVSLPRQPTRNSWKLLPN